MNDRQRSATPVSLEDLLKLKRAERPPAEFWADFEKSLRAKQLAAIVDKRPWWYAWRPALKWSLPISAAAAFGVALVSLNTTSTVARYDDAQDVGQTKPAVASLDIAAIEPSAAETIVVASIDRTAGGKLVQTAVVDPNPAQVSGGNDSRVASTDRPSSPSSSTSLSEQIAGVSVAAHSAEGNRPAFAEGLDDADATAGDFGELFQRAFAHLDNGFKTVRQPSNDPLTQLTTPRDARRARLLALTSALDANSPQYSSASNVIRSRERITNHLNDEALYDSIRRMGVKGNGVSIQF